ncbi:MAG: glycosyltransferase [Deltaproteobacteria bacterium]|nr:glycosyltransferase [Deltaproteobacteria bacterium]
MIDITMTATRRPELIRKTLDTFLSRFFFRANDCRLIINVDPVGRDMQSFEITDLCREYFPNIIYRCPNKPAFSRAFKWVWSQVTADFVFHLEDDWELMRPVDLTKMIKIMENNPDLAILRLPWKPTGIDSAKNWRYFFPWNGEFFECPRELRRTVGFCGHPSLIRGEFVRNTVKYIDETRNPEKQFHRGPSEIMAEIDKWRYGVFAEHDQPPAIRDIGRAWMVENGYRKVGNKALFTQWEEI